MSCAGCMNRRMPSSACTFWLRRAITVITGSRVPQGFRLMKMRPLLAVCPLLPAPTSEAKLATAGSLRTISFTRSWRAIMAS